MIIYLTDSTDSIFGMPKIFRKDTLRRLCCKWNNININIKERRLLIFRLFKDVGRTSDYKASYVWKTEDEEKEQRKSGLISDIIHEFAWRD
jgi:hypothetical protein